MSAEAPSRIFAEAEVTLTRLIDTPRARVFKAWIGPQQLAEGWGPEGVTNPVCEIDPRPGGRIWIVMRGHDGVDYPMSGRFQEIAEPEGLVLTEVAEDNQGKLCWKGSPRSPSPTWVARPSSPLERAQQP
ncbi:MAG: SRPBCC domain-containing protein [Methyloceanibacter sp.]